MKLTPVHRGGGGRREWREWRRRRVWSSKMLKNAQKCSKNHTISTFRSFPGS